MYEIENKRFERVSLAFFDHFYIKEYIKCRGYYVGYILCIDENS